MLKQQALTFRYCVEDSHEGVESEWDEEHSLAIAQVSLLSAELEEDYSKQEREKEGLADLRNELGVASQLIAHGASLQPSWNMYQKQQTGYHIVHSLVSSEVQLCWDVQHKHSMMILGKV